MSFSQKFPPEYEALIRDVSPGSDGILFCLPTDLDVEGNYGERYFIVTNEHMIVTDTSATSNNENNNGAANRSEANGHLAHRLSDIKEMHTEPLVGGGVLVSTIEGRRVELLQFTNSLAADFARVAKAINDFVTDETPISFEKLTVGSDEKRCKLCSRVLPVWSDVCPHCIDKRKVMRRIIGYSLPHWKLLIAVITLTLSSTALGLVPPWITKTLMDDVLVPPHKSPELLFPLIGAMAGIYLLSVFLGICRTWITVWLGGRITFDIRSQLYQRMQELTLRFFDKKQVGGLISRMTRDTDYLWNFAVMFTTDAVTSMVMLIGVGAVMFYMQPMLALFVLIPAPVIAIMTMVFFKRIRTMYHRLWHRWSKMSATLGEALWGIRVVKAFAQEPRETGRFTKEAQALFQQAVHVERTWAVFYPVIDLSMQIGSLLIYLIGGSMVLKGQTTIGALGAFQAYIWMFYFPLQTLGRSYTMIQQALTAGERIFEVIDSEPEKYNADDAVEMPDLKGEVEFRNVTFGYEKHVPVIKKLNLHIQPGEMIGLVGHSGAGKSTMINLICRFYDVDEGELLIDGVPIQKIKLHDVRRQIGVVPQESFLFSGTIAENIAYARPEASREDIIRSARAANAHDFIRKLPNGYDSEVGERGSRLSGGERQRIAIARAILHDPKILILDEATASVDTETESQIQQAIARLIQSRTTVAIAHRLSTLRNADRLCVLKGGELVEVGTHDELVEMKDGEYAKLVKMQADISKLKAVDG